MSPEISLIKKVGGMEYVVQYAPVKWAKIEMPSKFCPVINIPHLIPTEYFLIASAESMVTWSFVASRCSIPKS